MCDDVEEAMEFQYQSRNHDLYYNKEETRTRFFTGLDPYGR